MKKILLLTGVTLSLGVLAEQPFNVNFPTPGADEYVHQAPTIAELLVDESIHPELKSVILKGYDLFVNTQQLRGEYVFNDMNCSSCHLGGGGKNYAGPIWPANTQLPAYRGKNWQVNSLEERLVGCFTYSMNGISPDYGSDIMLSMVTYMQWLGTGAPLYNKQKIAGRGFGHLKKGPELPADYERGKQVYAANCAVCHSEDGSGKKVRGEVVFPAVWGDNSYNWGAGISRVFTLASFVHLNMPHSQPGKLSAQESWDVAQYINSQERPQDPRYTGDAKETREKYNNFHQYTLYGTEVNGVVLGQHDNYGHKPVAKPWPMAESRSFKDGSNHLMDY